MDDGVQVEFWALFKVSTFTQNNRKVFGKEVQKDYNWGR